MVSDKPHLHKSTGNRSLICDRSSKTNKVERGFRVKRGDILNKTAGKPVQTKWRSSRDLGEGFGRPGDKWLRQKEQLAPDGCGAGCVSDSGRPGARLVQRE